MRRRVGPEGGWQWQWVSVRCHNARHCWNPRSEIWIWWETFVPGAKTADQAVNMFHNCHIQGNYLLAKNEKLQIWLMLQWSHAITQLSCRWDCTNEIQNVMRLGSVLHWHLSWKQETLNTESEVKTTMLNCECNSTVDHLRYLTHPRYSISGINGLGWCT